MLTRIETEKTIWIGMTETQKLELIEAFIKLSADSNGFGLETNELQALNSFRQALLNV